MKLTVNGEINNENLAAADQLMDQNPFLETTMIADRLLLNWTQFNQKDEKIYFFCLLTTVCNDGVEIILSSQMIVVLGK